MSEQRAFIGDIHGEIYALNRALEFIEYRKIDRCVFLGDYINRGAHSKDVIERLIEFSGKCECVFIRGNHDQLMIDALTNAGSVGAFLKIGGADTLRSYLKGRKIGPDVFSEMQSLVPESHKQFLESTVRDWGSDSLYATHQGPTDPSRVTILGHKLVDRAVFEKKVIRIDTGCGMTNGKLTVLLAPAFQVNYFSTLP